MHCNFICSLSDVIIKNFSQSVSQSQNPELHLRGPASKGEREGRGKKGEGKERGKREGGKAEGKGREVPYFRLTLLATLQSTERT